MKKKTSKKNKNKSLSILITFIIISSIVILVLVREFNINKIFLDLEDKIGLSISFNTKSSLKLIPSLSFENLNFDVEDLNSSFISKNSSINIERKYWLTSPFYYKIKSQHISYDGIEFINSKISGRYNKKQIFFDKINSNFLEGELSLSGKMNLKHEDTFDFKGSIKNISINTFLEKINIASWKRVKIKLSSNNLLINGKRGNKNNFIKNLKANANISGTLFLISTEEERFGAALLSLLVDKIPNISSTSKSVNFLLSTYANIPTNISGDLFLENGILKTKNIKIENEFGKSSLIGSFDIVNDIIDGKIIFYEEEEIFLEASLEGKISDPIMLVRGTVVNNHNNTPKNIKKIFEEGISSFVDKLLKIND